MHAKEKPGIAGQQESTTRHFTTSDKPTGETEPSLEQQARQRAQARRKAGNGEVPPTPATTELHGPDFEQIPADLKALPQWVCWRLEERAGDITKVPYNAESGRRARSNDPTTWATFDTAVDAYHRGGYAGVGFMFWEGDGLTGLDLDHVIDLETGEIDPRALEILDRFKGTYCEISPSGTGFRIFTRGSSGRSGKNEGRGKWLEVYTHPSHRYLTVTGHHWPQSAVEVTAQQDALDWLHEKYFTKPAQSKPPTRPAQALTLGIDDTALIDKARAAANGHQFGQLWNGDTTAHRGDHSSADLGLCSMLAFWTGKDAGRMDRLFRQAGLMRSKWDSRRGDTTYGQITIDKAIIECTEVYTERGKGNGYDQVPPPDRWELPPLSAYEDAPESQGTRDRSGGASNSASSTKESKGDSDSDDYPPLPCRIFTLDDFMTEPKPAPFIITAFMPQDVCVNNATGGTGKSTFEIFRAIHIILGWPFLGMPIERPGPVLYVTSEDGSDRIHRRLFAIMEAMRLTPAQKREVADNFRVIDLCEHPLRLVTADRFGALVRTSLTERIITEYRSFAPVVVNFDPFVRFSPGEEYGNDGGDTTIAAMLTISRALSCATNAVHHISKAVYREGTIDHHAGRGPSSIGDGARCVYSLLLVEGDNKRLPGVTAAYQHYIDAGELMALFVTKLTDHKRPRDPFIIRRNGWTFELLDALTPERIEAAKQQARQGKTQCALIKVMDYLREWSFKHYTQADIIEAHNDMGASRDDVREAIRIGLRELRLVKKPLPDSEKTRSRRDGIYLAEGGRE